MYLLPQHLLRGTYQVLIGKHIGLRRKPKDGFPKKSEVEAHRKKSNMLRLVCVLPQVYEASDTMLKVYSFCEKEGICFDIRLYDSWKYQADSKYIEKLPAVHAYSGITRLDTLHEGDYLLGRIKHLLDKIRAKPRPSFLTRLKSFLRGKKKV